MPEDFKHVGYIGDVEFVPSAPKSDESGYQFAECSFSVSHTDSCGQANCHTTIKFDGWVPVDDLHSLMKSIRKVIS